MFSTSAAIAEGKRVGVNVSRLEDSRDRYRAMLERPDQYRRQDISDAHSEHLVALYAVTDAITHTPA